MLGWRFGLVVSCVALLAACGGAVARDSEANGGVAGSATSSSGGAPAAASGGSSGGVSSGGAQSSNDTPFMDPGCPEVPPRAGEFECDPLLDGAGCLPGYGCYPYVEHPSGRGCGAQIFGAQCRPAGSGLEGALCGDGTAGCAPGYVCVIGARPGRRCARLCRVDVAESCANGTLCEETDVQGYGVCN